jgi:hypothetical protein
MLKMLEKKTLSFQLLKLERIRDRCSLFAHREAISVTFNMEREAIKKSFYVDPDSKLYIGIEVYTK